MCFLLIATLFVAFTNTIREWADAIRMSADSLIVFSNAIRIFADGQVVLVLLLQKLLSILIVQM